MKVPQKGGEQLTYEVYIDVIFITNIIMNWILLDITNFVLKGKEKWLRRGAASVWGALGSCFLYFLKSRGMEQNASVIAIYFGFTLSMIFIAFSFRSIRKYIFAVLLLFCISFFFAGAQNWFLEFVLEEKHISWFEFTLFMLCIYVGTKWGLRVLFYQRKQEKYILPVEIVFHQKSIMAKGFYDSGNHLEEGMTRRPVVLVDYRLVKPLLEEEVQIFFDDYFNHQAVNLQMIAQQKLYQIKLIPYASLGNQGNVIPAIACEKIIVKYEPKEVVFRKVVLAMEEKLFEKKDYQLILHQKMREE